METRTAEDIEESTERLLQDLRAVVNDGEEISIRAGRHPVVALWPVALRHDLRRALGAGLRKIEAWTQTHGVALAAWPAEPVDPFFNVNTPEDAAEAGRMAQLGA